MRKKLIIISLVFLSISLFFGFLYAWKSDGKAKLVRQYGQNQIAKEDLIRYAPDRILVKFKKGASVNVGLDVVKHLSLIDLYVFRVPATETAAGLVRKLSQNPAVAYAEFDFIQTIEVVPNDPSFGLLWGMNNTGQTGGTADADIDTPEAWNFTTGSSSVVVAVIDTGVDYNHQDLSDNMWTNSGEIPGNGLDDDLNGYVDDYYGINSITGSGNPMDDHYHGTHCSGTIGGRGNNALGVAGVCWTVKIMACKFLDSTGSGYTDDAIECVQYAVSKGAHIMSNSWGGGGFSQSLKDAITAAQSAGILFIAAAGNTAGNNNDLFPHYPSSYDCENIIAVAATDHNDALASFSCYGPTSVDVAAPGVNIYSTRPSNTYGALNGTSMACPHVSGLCALLKAYNSSWDWVELKRRILGGVETKAGLAGKILTDGRINAYNSLFLDTTTPHIFSIRPPQGGVGTSVTLYGYSFGSTQSTGYVQFTGGAAAITSWADGKIVCTVPAGAQTGPVYVYNSLGLQSNGFNFTMLVPYYIESLVSNEFTGSGTAMNWRGDDISYSYDLPFTFNFFGTGYTRIYVCTNGFINFGAASTDYSNTQAELISNIRITPLWIDLKTDGSAQAGEDIYIAASASQVVIRWVAETYSYAEPMNFEAVLCSDGRIKFNYGSGNSNFHSLWASGPTIGISCGSCSYMYMLSPYNNQTTLTDVNTDLYTLAGSSIQPPTNFQATPASPTQINLTWTDNSYNETGFKVEGKIGASGTWVQVGTVGANVQAYQDTGRSPGTTYYYRVRAYNASTNSAYSNEANATTLGTTIPPPSDLQATAVSETQINLSWTDNSSNETGFKIQRKIGAGGAWVEITTVGAGVTAYQNTSLSPATTYYYRVKAYNGEGNSLNSNEASASTSASFVIPFNALNNGNVDLGNISGAMANVTIRALNASGSVVLNQSTTIPAMGVRRTWDLVGDIYDYGKPLTVEIGSDQTLSEDNIKWADPPYDTVGAGFTCAPVSQMKGTLFYFPFSSFGSVQGYAAISNTTSSTANITIQVYDAAGTLKKTQGMTVGPKGVARTWESLGNIATWADPALVKIVSDQDIVVEAVRWEQNKRGWGFAIFPSAIASGTSFLIPFNALNNGNVNLGNIGGATANVTLNIWSAAGAVVKTQGLTIPALGVKRTWDIIGDIYDYGKPVTVEVTSDQALAGDNIKWADPPYDTVGAGFNCAPVSQMKGTLFYFPFSSFGSVQGYAAISNATSSTANITIQVYDATGALKKTQAMTVGSRGVGRTWESLGNIATWADPALVKITSDQDIVVEAVRWEQNKRGWGFAILPIL